MVLIAANGDNARWCAPGHKVLAEVDGVPLIQRVIGQCRGRGIEPHVLSRHVAIARLATPVVMPQTPSLCDTLRYTADLWRAEPRVVVLLGDVLYTEPLVDEVLAYRGLLVRAWGSSDEVFAVTWARHVTAAVLAALDDACVHGRGKLWHLLRVLDGLPVQSHDRLPSIMRGVDDGTRDFDRREQLDEWLAERA